jgi:hypothetical protein
LHRKITGEYLPVDLLVNCITYNNGVAIGIGAVITGDQKAGFVGSGAGKKVQGILFF